MSPTAAGILGCIVLVVLLLSSMPVALAMGIVGFGGFALLRGLGPAMSMIGDDINSTFSSYSLTVIPLFVLMGQVAFHAGISRRLFATAYAWLGSLPGGLAMATVGACTGFGAICGSSPATAATMASVALPEMRRYGYSLELASGTVAAGGSLGMLIPPSVVFIVYGMMTEQSIGELFISGILPGLMIAALFCIAIYICCAARPSLGPAGPATTWREKLASLAGVSETLILFIAVMGGMLGGWFTPTEAAAVGAAGSIVVAIVERRLDLRTFIVTLEETARTTCMVMVIIAGAAMFGHFLAVTRIPYDLAAWLGGLPVPGWLVMGFIVLFYLAGGCVVDALALILLTVPIFYPVVQGLGYDLIWFGVIIVVVTQMGVITPPVGVNVFVVSGIARDIPLQTIFKGSMVFLAALIVASAILIAFPDIALVLPRALH